MSGQLAPPPPPPGWPQPPPPPGWLPPPPPPPSKSGAGWIVGVIVVVVLVVIVLAAGFAPLPHPFTAQLDTGGFSVPTWTLNAPVGSSVSGSWNTASGGTVTLAISDANGHLAYSEDAASGTFSFAANDPPYQFGAYSILSQTVSVSGEYAAAYL